ncbi:hypothetical protein BH10PSE15_BH10PSE15_04530 [soil metagenome]
MAGGWRVRLTSRGTAHMVKQQQMPMSCGMASCAMVNYKMKKGALLTAVAEDAALSVGIPIFGAMIGAELTREAVDYAVKSEPEVYKIYSQVTGSPYDGNIGTDVEKYPEVLRQLNCGDWETLTVPANGVGNSISSALLRGSPVIACVSWFSGGSHAVVIDPTFYAPGQTWFVCDPGDGDVHVTATSNEKLVFYRGMRGTFDGRFCARTSGVAPYSPATG